MVDRRELELHPETEKELCPPKRVDPGLTDEQAFAHAMEDASVQALGWSTSPIADRRPFEIPHWSDGEDEALSTLEAFVSGRGEMDPFAMGEGIEGASGREGRKFLARLKRGAFSVQDQLDLHGLAVADAKQALEAFLRRSQHRGHHCVRIVHGRGRHSPTEPHLMKTAVTKWLGSRKLRRTVIAYASARWKDGGSGAVYVLLYGRFRAAQR